MALTVGTATGLTMAAILAGLLTAEVRNFCRERRAKKIIRERSKSGEGYEDKLLRAAVLEELSELKREHEQLKRFVRAMAEDSDFDVKRLF